jgi:hypothetical protein
MAAGLADLGHAPRACLKIAWESIKFIKIAIYIQTLNGYSLRRCSCLPALLAADLRPLTPFQLSPA